MLTLEIENNSVLEKYNQQQLQTLFLEFIEELEREEKQSPVLLQKVDFEDLAEDEKQATINFRKNKENMEFYNLSTKEYEV